MTTSEFVAIAIKLAKAIDGVDQPISIAGKMEEVGVWQSALAEEFLAAAKAQPEWKK